MQSAGKDCPYYAQSQPAAAPQGEVQRQPCVGCDSGAYGSAETNFLCSVCYKKHTSAAAGYNCLKCRSPGCQQQGLTSKDGYCNECYAKIAANLAAHNDLPHSSNQFSKEEGGSPHTSKDQHPQLYQQHYQQKTYKQQPGKSNQGYDNHATKCFHKPIGSKEGSGNHGKTDAAANYRGTASLQLQFQKPPIRYTETPRVPVSCKYPGCSFYAIPEFENYCQDCYETKSGLKNYRHSKEGSGNHGKTDAAANYRGTASLQLQFQKPPIRYTETPRVPVSCKYPGCSFYAIPEFENYCQDCYETKSGLKNYWHSKEGSGNHGKSDAAADYRGTASPQLQFQKPPIRYTETPRVPVSCKYPGCSFYAIPEFENYCQDCYETKSGLKNYRHSKEGSGNHGKTDAAANYRGTASLQLQFQKPPIRYTETPRVPVSCKYPGCSFYAIPEFENYCQDCYETKSGLKNYRQCKTPNCPNHVPTSNTKNFCDTCSDDDKPRARVLCRYPGCSFYAIPEFENYCQDCYETKSGLKNYRRCKTPTCANLVPTSSTKNFCDTCLVSSAKIPRH